MHMIGTLLPAMVLVHSLCGVPLALADTRSFKVQFTGCSEFVGWGPISLAGAEPLVAAGYVIAELPMDKPQSSFGR